MMAGSQGKTKKHLRTHGSPYKKRDTIGFLFLFLDIFFFLQGWE
jgi:hypothetical protein